ncbi:MAG: CRISPR-associated endonuclease Cas3'' [Candidatus Sumerlaeota bacterium]|nr:CRISPR-associated endonuclease Cas3'' [Candidatus Sumerlaeota bacterium]
MRQVECFARSLEGSSDPAKWQPLEAHLWETADFAADFASAFDSGEWGRLAGLWHDLGKYQPEFQEKLRGKAIAIEHSGLGAALAAGKHPAGKALQHDELLRARS